MHGGAATRQNASWWPRRRLPRRSPLAELAGNGHKEGRGAGNGKGMPRASRARVGFWRRCLPKEKRGTGGMEPGGRGRFGRGTI